MMMPVVPSVKKSNGFSIDSLMAKDKPEKKADRSPTRTPTEPKEIAIGGVRSSFQPVTPGTSHLLNGLKGIYSQNEHGGLPHPHEGLPASMLASSLSALPGLHNLPTHGALPPGLSHFHHSGLPHTIHPLLMGQHRDPYPIYPWLMSRHGHFFNHRFAGHEAGLLLQPFRKPKRIRTAFSPSQLLRLEHAFEKNHYVVGQERKDLASNLSLTETQVKVWFQNRRTKYKRMKAEEGDDSKGHVSSANEHSDESESEIEDVEDSLVRSPPSSPASKSSDNVSHHLNKWRVETNQPPLSFHAD